MELYKEILAHILQNEELHVIFPNLEIDAAAIIEGECCTEQQKDTRWVSFCCSRARLVLQ